MKTRSIKTLLRLLECDPNEEAPSSFRDAVDQANVIPLKSGIKRGACGKVDFASKKACREAIRSRLRYGKSDVSRLREYWCSQCSAWHITSSCGN